MKAKKVKPEEKVTYTDRGIGVRSAGAFGDISLMRYYNMCQLALGILFSRAQDGETACAEALRRAAVCLANDAGSIPETPAKERVLPFDDDDGCPL